jgi:hypothetical protein
MVSRELDLLLRILYFGIYIFRVGFKGEGPGWSLRGLLET